MLRKGHILVILVISISTLSLFASAQLYEKYVIPNWVKGVAGFWAEDKITDTDFGEGLAFLIDNGIIEVPKIESLESKINSLEQENAQLRAQLEGGGSENIEAISVYTDKSSYVDGDYIIVYGDVRELVFLDTNVIAITVNDPFGELITLAQVDINKDKKFAVSFRSGGPLWELSGIYNVKVAYGSMARTAETTFQFSS